MDNANNIAIGYMQYENMIGHIFNYLRLIYIIQYLLENIAYRPILTFRFKRQQDVGSSTEPISIPYPINPTTIWL